LLKILLLVCKESVIVAFSTPEDANSNINYSLLEECVMTYEQMASIAGIQRKQLMTVLAAFFVAMVGAVLFTAFIVSSMVRNQAHALAPQTVRIIPAAVTDSTSCSVPGGAGGGEAAASTGGAGGGGASVAMLTGGQGAGGAGGTMISGGTFSWTISRNVNSGNNYGSFNGGNSSSVTNNQGSNNTVSGDLSQSNWAVNKPTTDTKVIVKESGNTEDSNNNTDITKTTTVTKTEDSNNTTNTTNNDESFNNLDLTLTPPTYVGEPAS
jgi:hypothetical protein